MGVEWAMIKTLKERFSEARDTYLADIKISSKSEHTHEKYLLVLNHFQRWMDGAELSDKDTDFSPLHVIQFKQYLAQIPVKINTIYHYLIVLHTFFKWSKRAGFFSENPVTEDCFPATEEIKYDILTKEEMDIVVSGFLPRRIYKKTRARNKALVLLLIQSGLRVSELINLRVYDVSFDRNNIHVVNGKGSKSRYAPLPEEAKQALYEYFKDYEKQHGKALAATAYLFCGEDGSDQNKPLTRSGVGRIVETYVRLLTGHEGIGPHDLRHCAASMWDNTGANMRTIQNALGHSSILTTERIYVKLLDKEKAAQDIVALMGAKKKAVRDEQEARQEPSSVSSPPSARQERTVQISFLN